MTPHEPIDDGVVQPTMPWPFPGDVFPRDLGAVVMQEVLSGNAPALQVVHFNDGYWGVADGQKVPSSKNLEATHIWHVLTMDGSIAELATLPPGCRADRDSPGQPWVVTPIDTTPDPTSWDRLRARYEIFRFGEPEAHRRWVERFGERRGGLDSG